LQGAEKEKNMTEANWQFVYEHENDDVTQLLLKKKQYPKVDVIWCARQIEARQKAKKKLPTWYGTKKIVFPARVSIEQSSSEATAMFKASLFKGERMIDITGGFGVDAARFTKNFKKVTYCEQMAELAETVALNKEVLGIENLEVCQGNGLDILQNSREKYDLVYLDPARRDAGNRKVVLLEDYQPNVLQYLDLFFEKADEVLIKTSPMLDVPQAIKQLKKVRHVWVVSVQNEVKELLFTLHKYQDQQAQITAAMLYGKGVSTFSSPFDRLRTAVDLHLPLKFLYEPHPALLKAALQNAYAGKLNLYKLHANSHLYTSDRLISGFYGRAFHVESVFSLNKKDLKKHLTESKANITVRNFPLNVAAIRKKTGLKEGGEVYIFATTLHNDQKVLLKCKKIDG